MLKLDMASLDNLSIVEFEEDMSCRVTNMSAIMGIEPDAKSPKLRRYMVEISKSVHDVFEETNAVLGQTWLWSWKKFYFARESDATWFRLRWS